MGLWPGSALAAPPGTCWHVPDRGYGYCGRVRVVWWVSGTAFAVVGAGLSAVVLARGGGLPALLVVLTPLPGWSFGVAGLVACARPRWRRPGLLLLGVGLAWFVHLLPWTHAPVLVTLAEPITCMYGAVLAHLLLTYPSGRVRSPGIAVLVVIGYVVAVGAAMIAVAEVAAVVVGTVVVAVVARRAATAVTVTAVTALAALLTSLVAERIDRWAALAAWVLFSAAFAAMPVALLAELLGIRLRRARVAALVVRLGRAADPAGLRAALAEALRDPTLEVAYWVADRYVDDSGRRMDWPDDRFATPVERDGRRIGALVHSAASRSDPELVAAVAAAAGFALENARLQAELRARLAELQQSRARMVETAAAERRRIERNLHDGAQQRLVSVAYALGLARSRLLAGEAQAGLAFALDDARAGLAMALDELRSLAQGIHPGVLTECGLRTAIEELGWGAPMPVELRWDAPERLPASIELVAYYVVAESLTNAAKHAQATRVTVEVSTVDSLVRVTVADDGCGGATLGTGLRGLADRASSLGGTLTIHSGPDGTAVQAVLPCG